MTVRQIMQIFVALFWKLFEKQTYPQHLGFQRKSEAPGPPENLGEISKSKESLNFIKDSNLPRVLGRLPPLTGNGAAGKGTTSWPASCEKLC